MLGKPMSRLTGRNLSEAIRQAENYCGVESREENFG